MRFDETEVGKGAYVSLVNAVADVEWVKSNKGEPWKMASEVGMVGAQEPEGLVEWDVFEAILQPGELVLLASWRDKEALLEFERSASLKDGMRLRNVRVVRDYGMYDRREAPQYYPDVPGRETLHVGS